jgi:small subunit ribosomal protein S1
MHDDPINAEFADDNDSVDQESSEFSELLEQSGESRPEPKPGEKVTGTVVQVGADEIHVDIGARSELPMSAAEFRGEDGTVACEVGQQVTAYVVKTKEGLALSSSMKAGDAGRDEALEALRQAMEAGVPVEGKVQSTNKGGFSVEVGGMRGFCPFSQMDLRRIDDPTPYENTTQRFKILEISPDGRNVVLSRRALLQEERDQAAASTRARLARGEVFEGTVTRLMPYGAFVDIGGIEGLVHVSQISHQRISDPGDVLREGQQVRVEVVEIQAGDGRRERISLSMKTLADDPWPAEAGAFEIGQDVPGTVTRLADFGAFVQLKPGIEGMVHISELSERRLLHPREVLNEGDEITVRVMAVDLDRRRISLSRRQAGDYAGD